MHTAGSSGDFSYTAELSRFYDRTKNLRSPVEHVFTTCSTNRLRFTCIMIAPIPVSD